MRSPSPWWNRAPQLTLDDRARAWKEARTGRTWNLETLPSLLVLVAWILIIAFVAATKHSGKDSGRGLTPTIPPASGSFYRPLTSPERVPQEGRAEAAPGTTLGAGK